jgi:hypothetical protein
LWLSCVCLADKTRQDNHKTITKRNKTRQDNLESTTRQPQQDKMKSSVIIFYQMNSRRDETRQDKTRLYETRQGKTRKDNHKTTTRQLQDT